MTGRGTTAGPFSVGILGLGRISEGYDQPQGPAVATHIKACLQDPRLHIAWLADVDTARAEAVRARWNLSAEILSPDALIKRQSDILCIASPDATHASCVQGALPANPRIILCEKPLAQTLAEAQRLTTTCKTAGVSLVVNFPRRWLPGLTSWLTNARNGAFGTPVAARALYCRGLKHNACHALDLIGAALGSDHVSVAETGPRIFDFDRTDPTVSATLAVRHKDHTVPVMLTGVDGRTANAFDVDIVFARSRVRIWNEQGIRMQIHDVGKPIDNVLAGEYVQSTAFHDQPVRYMVAVWKNLADHIATGEVLQSSAESTLDGTSLVDAVAQVTHAA